MTEENYVNDWPALLEKYWKIDRICPRPLLQEYIEGEGFGYFALIDKGELLAQFAHRRLREYPLSGGSSTLREGIAPARMQELGCALLKAMDWSGVAMVEFRRDRRDGEFKVLEVNGRWWGSLPLANGSGVHFPWLYYCLLTGRSLERELTYQPGKLCRLLLPNDLLWFGASLFSRRDRLKVIREFMDFRGQDFDILSLSDPLPTLGALWGMFRHFILILSGKESFSGEYH